MSGMINVGAVNVVELCGNFGSLGKFERLDSVRGELASLKTVPDRRNLAIRPSIGQFFLAGRPGARSTTPRSTTQIDNP
jgi:hypothetical protein